jgi:hypothetical protein
VTTSNADAAASPTSTVLPPNAIATTIAPPTTAAICAGPVPINATRASAMPMPSATPITISIAERRRCPSDALTPISAATGAKIGRSWPKICCARTHAVAVASAACASHPTLARRRSAMMLGRERSTASSISAFPRSRARAA